MSVAFDEAIQGLNSEMAYGNLLDRVFFSQFPYKRSSVSGNTTGREDPNILLEEIFGWITLRVSKDLSKIQRIWEDVPFAAQHNFREFVHDMIRHGCLTSQMVNRWKDFGTH